MKTFCPISFWLQSDREMFQPGRSATDAPRWVDRVKAFLRGFITCTEGRSQSANRLLNSSAANISSITTPNGLWVYTVVPWED